MQAVGLRGVPQAQHTGIEKQATVAVFGQAGQGVQSVDLNTGPLKGLQQ